MLSPADETDLSAAVRDATGPMRIVGGGTRGVGPAGAGEVLSLAAMAGIELYEPGALTLVAKAGTPLAEIEATLAAEGQMLPFEPTDLSALFGVPGQSTIGGVVSTNASGPRRLSAGACRDALLGVRFVDGSGAIVKNGGRVMKNVTGYDLVKLMAGAHGTLGVVTEVAFKVLPKLGSASVIVRGVGAAQALEAMTRAVTSPYEVTGAAYLPTEGAVLRVEGLDVSTAYRVERLTALLSDLGEVELVDVPEASAALWARIRNVDDFADGSAAIWRVSAKPSDMVETILPAVAGMAAAEHLLDWAGGLAWIRLPDGANEDLIRQVHTGLQAQMSAIGGHATLIKAPGALRAELPRFQPEAPGIAALSRGLRTKFDPRGILNPGLMGH